MLVRGMLRTAPRANLPVSELIRTVTSDTFDSLVLECEEPCVVEFIRRG
jgi:hypothetical protein